MPTLNLKKKTKPTIIFTRKKKKPTRRPRRKANGNMFAQATRIV